MMNTPVESVVLVEFLDEHMIGEARTGKSRTTARQFKMCPSQVMSFIASLPEEAVMVNVRPSKRARAAMPARRRIRVNSKA